MLSSRGSLTRLGHRGLPKEWQDQHPSGPARTDQRRAVSSCPASAALGLELEAGYGPGSGCCPSQKIWGLFPSPGPRRACPTASLSRTQTLPGFARETGNFCPAASLGGFRHSAQRGTGRSQAAPGSAFSRLCLGGMGGGLR